MNPNTNKKSIVFMGPCHPYRGGIASFTERLAKEFNQNGFETKLITFTLQYPSFLFPGKTQFSKEDTPAGLTIQRLINSINPLNWIYSGFKIMKEKPDLIIVRYWLPFLGPAFGTILRIVKLNHHTKVICIADNIIPHEKRFGDSIFTRYFSKPVDAFIAMSMQVMNDFKKLNLNHTSALLHHPLFDHFGEKIDKESARNELGIEKETKLILFFGFIRKYKGLDLLIEALSNKRLKNQNIKLIIAGEFYEDKSKYIDLINFFGIESMVEIHDNFIPENKIPVYFSAADVLIQPYRHATQSGVTPLSYHFELPMIVTNVGGLKEMVEDGVSGLVANPNHKSIADKIEEYFITGKEKYQSNLVQMKSKYSWNTMMNGIMELFSRLD